MNQLTTTETPLPAIRSQTRLPTLSHRIEHWQPSYGCDEAEALRAYGDLPKYEEALRPMPKAQIKTLFKGFWTPFKAQVMSQGKLSEAEQVALAKLHFENFCEFPADLVEPSMRHVAMNFKWGIPKPGDYRGCIQDEWARRRRAYCTLKHYLEYYEKYEKPKIEVDKKLQADLAKERAERDVRIRVAVGAYKKKHGREPTKEEMAAIERADDDFILYGKEPKRQAA